MIESRKRRIPQGLKTEHLFDSDGVAEATPFKTRSVARLKRLRKKSFPSEECSPQRLKPDSKQSLYRSGKPLRHPKNKCNTEFFRSP